MEDQRIAHIALDEKTITRLSPQVEHERKVAIYDLLEQNFFAPVTGELGPFHLYLSNIDGRLIFDVRDENEVKLLRIRIPAKSFRRIIRDYFMICETYFEAIKTKTPSQIETIDMGRRGLHNEGADVLKERVEEQVEVDHQTARRLFTLICVLHIKG